VYSQVLLDGLMMYSQVSLDDVMLLMQVYSKESNSGAITGLRYSNDGTRLATVSKDCTVIIYDVPKYQQLARISVVGPAMGCDWSRDDSRLCVALSGGVAGMALINTGNYSVFSQEKVGSTCKIR